jgi:hypothetical protein
MRVLRTVGLLALAALLVYALPAAAQDKMCGSLYAGYAKIMNSGAPGGSIGGRLNGFYMVTPMIGVGAEGGFSMLGKDKDTEVKFSMIQATAQFMARGNKGSARPYGTAGGGLYSARASLGGVSETSSRGGFNAGAGVQYKPNAESKIGFGLEVRGHLILKKGDETESTKLLTAMAGVTFN